MPVSMNECWINHPAKLDSPLIATRFPELYHSCRFGVTICVMNLRTYIWLRRHGGKRDIPGKCSMHVILQVESPFFPISLRQSRWEGERLYGIKRAITWTLALNNASVVLICIALSLWQCRAATSSRKFNIELIDRFRTIASREFCPRHQAMQDANCCVLSHRINIQIAGTKWWGSK